MPGPSRPGDIGIVLNNLRRLTPYFRPYRTTYAVGLALVIVSNFLLTLGPRFIEQGVNALAAGHDLAGVRRAALLLLGSALLGGIARYGMRQTLNSGSRRVEYDLRNELFRHLQTLSADFYDRAPDRRPDGPAHQRPPGGPHGGRPGRHVPGRHLHPGLSSSSR